jgi:hypothetical protein
MKNKNRVSQLEEAEQTCPQVIHLVSMIGLSRGVSGGFFNCCAGWGGSLVCQVRHLSPASTSGFVDCTVAFCFLVH